MRPAPGGFYDESPTKRTRFTPQPIIKSSERVYREFRKQAEAIDFASSARRDQGPPLRVFAEEVGEQGQRVYIVASYLTLWQESRSVWPRYYSEVICDGLPCHAYFDVEFYHSCNPEADSNLMLSFLVERVLVAFSEIGIQRRRISLFDLDSSTSVKFSHHLLFHVEGAAFKTNLSLGEFVCELCSTMEREALAASDSGANCLLVRPTEGSDRDRLFVDMGVYTRNRCFRMYKSAKFNKNIPLLPRGMTIQQARQLPEQEDRSLFFKSLVCNVSPAHFLIDYTRPGMAQPKPTKHLLANNGAAVARSCWPYLERFLVEFWDSRMTDSEFDSDRWWQCTEATASRLEPRPTRTQIRSCVRVPESHILVYSLLNNRWCGNIQRQHKSNGVKLVVFEDSCVLYQSCFDVDCRSYKSPRFQVPPWILGKSEPQAEILVGLPLVHLEDEEWDEAFVSELEAIAAQNGKSGN